MDEQAGPPKRPGKSGALVLVSFGLVLLATALRVVGALVEGLTVIYLSIACSAAAAITLLVAVRMSKRGGGSRGNL